MLDPHWWFLEADMDARRRLMWRIKREGFVLPILTVLAVGFLAEMYAEPGHASDIVPRLRYESGPLADFGIAAGSATVTGVDKLNYVEVEVDTPNRRATRGQDPDDHYWFYFRTVLGEELKVDCNMSNFEMNWMVRVNEPGQSGVPRYTYIPRALGPEARAGGWTVPGLLEDRTLRHGLPLNTRLWTERRRAGVLRDSDLQAMVSRSSFGSRPKQLYQAEDDSRAMAGFMSRLARREISKTELALAMTLVREHTLFLRGALAGCEWRSYPEHPLHGPDLGPGETLDLEAKHKKLFQHIGNLGRR